jgi:integrase
MKVPTGFVSQDESGPWRARITYTDRTTGKRVNRKQSGFPSEAAAQDWLAKERRRIGAGGSPGRPKSWDELAAYYLEHHVTEPVWRDGRVVGGMRDWKSTAGRVKQLDQYLEGTPLSMVSYAKLRQIQAAELARPSFKGTPQAIATVNRLLSVVRTMLSLAVQLRWIERTPFNDGQPLIRKSEEVHRQRVLTLEEEGRLLAVCSGKRKHIRPIVITALDTGMRLGELIKLRWKDIDLKVGLITIIASHSKTLRRRQVGMTERVKEELGRLWDCSPQDPDGSVFGLKSLGHAFETARQKAGLDEDVIDTDGHVVRSRLRFHDLRHTAATRLVEGGLSLAMTGNILGHSKPEMTYRYTNADASTAKHAARVLSRGPAWGRSRLLAARKVLTIRARQAQPSSNSNIPAERAGQS